MMLKKIKKDEQLLNIRAYMNYFPFPFHFLLFLKVASCVCAQTVVGYFPLLLCSHNLPITRANTINYFGICSVFLTREIPRDARGVRAPRIHTDLVVVNMPCCRLQASLGEIKWKRHDWLWWKPCYGVCDAGAHSHEESQPKFTNLYVSGHVWAQITDNLR